jgi:quinol monooxygenase YgiN
MQAFAYNTVHIRAAVGRSSELGERLQGIVDAVRTAPGCLDYTIQRDPVDPDLWTVNGRWACVRQLNAHFALPALQGFIELTREHLALRLEFDH